MYCTSCFVFVFFNTKAQFELLCVLLRLLLLLFVSVVIVQLKSHLGITIEFGHDKNMTK